MSKEKEILETLLGGGTVAYHVTFAKAFGSIQAGLWLSQGVFWQCKSKFATRVVLEGKTYFECTVADFYDQTGLSPEQQSGAKDKLKQAGVLLEKRIGLPSKLVYHIDFEALATVLYRYNETGKAATVKHRDKQRYNTRTVDGKFRPTATVKHRGIIIESNESLESDIERSPAPGVETSTFEENPNKKGLLPAAAAPQKPAQADHALTYDQRPYPVDANDLKEKMRAYFTANYTQWTDAVLVNGKATNWSTEKIGDTITAFCLHKQKTGDMQRTYHEYTADLTMWFLRQPGFDSKNNVPETKSTQKEPMYKRLSN